MEDEDAAKTTAIPVLKGPRLRVEIKTAGRVTDLGTVDSVQLLWQVLSNGLTLYPARMHQGDVHNTFDPTASAMAETIANNIWRSHMAQIFVSLRMARRTLSLFYLWFIVASACASVYIRSQIYELLCDRFPSVASCPTDGAGMRARLHQLEGIQSMVVVVTISAATATIVLISIVCPWINNDRWHRSASSVSFIVVGLFWDFRVSLLESLFGSAYEHKDWVVASPILGLLISGAAQTVAVWFGDSPMYLLAWSLGIAAKLGFLLTVVVWAWRTRVLQLLAVIIVVPRMVRGTVRFTRSLFGAARFRKPGAYTHGVHFFATDTGVMGSTSDGPVQLPRTPMFGIYYGYDKERDRLRKQYIWL
ncbi:hypothetical protein B0T18DRAFT_431666 [Schizothecium vesticola]|uniref:Transmembrane protein n=1 Tax=Schizothecium vesticola TaxID=314040 RepID=A0AA40EJD0_9PEZI|nr:hypothetical protein B0T18DRAFT_431666 [Schizothecium vesticola]